MLCGAFVFLNAVGEQLLMELCLFVFYGSKQVSLGAQWLIFFS